MSKIIPALRVSSGVRYTPSSQIHSPAPVIHHNFLPRPTPQMFVPSRCKFITAVCITIDRSVIGPSDFFLFRQCDVWSICDASAQPHAVPVVPVLVLETQSSRLHNDNCHEKILTVSVEGFASCSCSNTRRDMKAHRPWC